MERFIRRKDNKATTAISRTGIMSKRKPKKPSTLSPEERHEFYMKMDLEMLEIIATLSAVAEKYYNMRTSKLGKYLAGDNGLTVTDYQEKC